jgi:transcriptional regulator GlxA family with amidase domain
MAKRIGFIGYDNITALDLIAPLEAFGTANTFVEGRPHAYELIVMSASGKPFRSELGVSICASIAFKDAPPLDTILVPGGAGLRDPNISEPVVSFLKARARSTRRVASVCTGLEALAQAGLMNGRRATTHWRFAASIAKKFPRVLIDSDDIYRQDGGCAGACCVPEALRRSGAIFRAPAIPDAVQRWIFRFGRVDTSQSQEGSVSRSSCEAGESWSAAFFAPV